VVAGLIAGDLIGGIAGTPAALLGDWKTAHLTRTSVLSMLLTNLVGGVIGCLPGPLIFQIFWKAFPIGDPTGCARQPRVWDFARVAQYQIFWEALPVGDPAGRGGGGGAPRGQRQGSQAASAAACLWKLFVSLSMVPLVLNTRLQCLEHSRSSHAN